MKRAAGIEGETYAAVAPLNRNAMHARAILENSQLFSRLKQISRLKQTTDFTDNTDIWRKGQQHYQQVFSVTFVPSVVNYFIWLN